tara:strand:+ start:3553 stop:4470 length:918 start_codon:yes stop_codon:yes gene_type:complete
MISTFHLTNESFGKSKAIHSPVDLDIKKALTYQYGSYVESTNENTGTSSEKRRDKWNVCAEQVRKFLSPVIDTSEYKWAYPTNGIHESIDAMCNWVDEYQIFKGEYRYSSFVKTPKHIATTPEDLIDGVPLYMSNPFSATGCFDERYEEVINSDLDIDIYLDLAFIGTTGPHKIPVNKKVKQIFWSVSKPYGLGLLRAGIRFSRREELIQRELQGVGYFNHAIIDVFKAVTLNSSVFDKKEMYRQKQEAICSQFNLIPSDSYLLGTTFDSAWDRFKRESGVNRVCLTPAYESMNEEMETIQWPVF